MEIISVGKFAYGDIYSKNSEEVLACEIIDCLGDCGDCSDTSSCFSLC